MAISIEEQVPLAALTTIRLGGAARYFVRVSSVAELQEALTWAQQQSLPIHILGGGSNTIFRDEGFGGLVIRIAIQGVSFGEEGRVEVAAGEDWDPFVAQCVERGLAGVECLSGIPGLAGATPIQNVGAYGQEVSQTISLVEALNVATLQTQTFTPGECEFQYRWSRFKGAEAGKYVITRVVFQLRPGGEPALTYQQVKEAVASSSPTLSDVREAVLALRKKKSMVLDEADPHTCSCGSFFENLQLSSQELAKLEQRVRAAGITQELPTFQETGVTRVPSAWLIEQAGFPKGFRRGGAGISINHNLALVNYGGTAQELLALADEIVAAVQKKFGVKLKREPVVVP